MRIYFVVFAENAWDTIPYFSERYRIDLLVKTDKTIARSPMQTSSGLSQWAYFYPGHLKWDYGYSIGQQKPDIVLQVWQGADEAIHFLTKNYLIAKANCYPMFFARGRATSSGAIFQG